MKKLLLIIPCVVLLVCCWNAPAQTQTSAQAKSSAKPAAGGKAGDEGERRFRDNCGRCHNPPDSLSPREVKAVLQQMRVRANLTAEDEKLILKYLAP